jgi:hypothetical protein
MRARRTILMHTASSRYQSKFKFLKRPIPMFTQIENSRGEAHNASPRRAREESHVSVGLPSALH